MGEDGARTYTQPSQNGPGLGLNTARPSASSNSGFSRDTNHTNAPQKPLREEARLVRGGSVRKKEQKQYR